MELTDTDLTGLQSIAVDMMACTTSREYRVAHMLGQTVVSKWQAKRMD